MRSRQDTTVGIESTQRCVSLTHCVLTPQNLAEEQEKAGATEDCISFYSQAAELFAAEDSTSEAAKCRQKVPYTAPSVRMRMRFSLFDVHTTSESQSGLSLSSMETGVKIRVPWSGSCDPIAPVAHAVLRCASKERRSTLAFMNHGWPLAGSPSEQMT